VIDSGTNTRTKPVLTRNGGKLCCSITGWKWDRFLQEPSPTNQRKHNSESSPVQSNFDREVNYPFIEAGFDAGGEF